MLGQLFVFTICLLIFAIGGHAQNTDKLDDGMSIYHKELSSLGHLKAPTVKTPTFSFEFRDALLKDALQEVADEGRMKLLFNHSLFPGDHKVSMKLENVNLREAFDQILNRKPLDFMMAGNGYVIIVPKLDLKKLMIQVETITGTVTDGNTGGPLPGVNIAVKGTNIGTSTNSDGMYELNVPSLNDTLLFSFIGYQTQEIPINGRTELDVEMVSTAIAGEEVVVVGYGTQEKVNLTGSVGTASSDRLEARSIANTGEGLQGVIPNLNVTVRNGDPSESPSFNVRGYESINGGSPLILVDGVPMDINRINPSDIESISVLKDASAAAVYGARAAFGVVLVETKGGQRSGTIDVSLNSQWSLAKPIFNMDPVTNPHEFVLARNRANMRTNGAPSYDEDYIEGTRRWVENPTKENAWGVVDGSLRYYGFNDYHNRIMTDFAPTQQHDLSVSGGTDNATYYVSLGHLNKDGYLKPANNENFKRYNVLIQADFDVTDWLRLEERVQYNSEISDKPHFYNWDVNINTLARVNPIMPVQFPDLEYYMEPGDREQYEQYIGMYFGGTNFFPYLLDGGRTQYTNNDTWFKQGITLTPLENLSIKGDFSFNSFNRDYRDVASKIDIVSTDLTDPSPVSNGFSGDDWLDERKNNNQYYVINAYAEYIFNQFQNHDIKAMVGFNQEWGINKYVRAQARSLITPLITDLNATVGTQNTFGSSSDVALRGAFYRLNYNYKDRYLIETNGRYDGTSRFPEDDRFGFFPSVSVGWRLSNEAFMAGTEDIFENLKIRASYGELGNQLLVDDNDNPIYYPYIATMGIGQSPYIMTSGQIPYVSAPGLVSPTLTWETVVSKNIGLDFSMFGGRLEAAFDVYTRETNDMLMDVEYPNILGTDAPQSNAADLRTSGWELELTWRNVVNNDFNYDVTLALSDWTSEITKYENPSGALSEYYVGQQIGDIWGYETVGIFQTEDEVANAPDQSQIGSNWRPGDVRYADLNGDGVISPGSNTLDDPGDRTIIGNSTPRGSYGVNVGISYKNFRLTTFFQGVMQKDYWPSSGNWTWFFPFNAGHVEKYYITDTWSEDNRDAYFPAPHISTNTKKNVQVQSRYLQNAAYVRLKNLTLSYNLPRNLLNKIGLDQARIYFTGMNLLELSPIRKPLDPEYLYGGEGGYGGNGAIEYPLQRVFTLGTQVSL